MADMERTIKRVEDETKLFFIDVYIVKNGIVKKSWSSKTGNKDLGSCMVMATFWDENGLQYSLDIKDYLMEYYNKPYISEEMVSKFKDDAKAGLMKFRYNEGLEILY